MFQLALPFIVAAFVSVQASPFRVHQKRIAQTVSDSLVSWQQACVSACPNNTISLNCNALAVKAYNTLLAAAGPCDQQNAADGFIDFAKQLPNSNSSIRMIALSTVFAQQPRNSPSSLSMPYCQEAPSNGELNGLYQCQWVDDNPKLFFTGANSAPIKLGAPGTIPLGLTSVQPLGSCPAHGSGPIEDGTQLVDTIPNAGITGGGGGGSNSGPTAPATTSSTGTVSSPTTTSGSGSTSAPSDSVTVPATGTTLTFHTTTARGTAVDLDVVSTSIPAGPSSLAAIVAANQKLAQQYNAGNASLTPESPCTEGETACIQGSFAECVTGAYVLTPCAADLSCFILPLLLKQGTSTACDTTADAIARSAIAGSVTTPTPTTNSGSGPTTTATSSSVTSPTITSSSSVPTTPTFSSVTSPTTTM